MMQIKQRLPNFVQHDPSQFPIHEVNTLTDLLAIDFVQRWASSPNFKCLEWNSCGRNVDRPTQHLMAIMQDNFWVIGYARDGSLADLGLNQWKEPR